MIRGVFDPEHLNGRGPARCYAVRRVLPDVIAIAPGVHGQPPATPHPPCSRSPRLKAPEQGTKDWPSVGQAAPPAPPRSIRLGPAISPAAPDRSWQTLPNGRESRPERRDTPDDLHWHRLARKELGNPGRPRDAIIDDQLAVGAALC